MLGLLGWIAVACKHPEADAVVALGAQGSAAICTGGEHGAWAALRKVSIRTHS
jgi:hypothetical protein